jgi:hypothetical protein
MKGKVSIDSVTCSTPDEERWAMNRLCEFFGVSELTARDVVSHVNNLIIENDNLRKRVASQVEQPQEQIDNGPVTPLIAFLYQLIRDEVTPGRIERIMADQHNSIYEKGATGWKLSNMFIEEYARDIIKRLEQQSRDIFGDHEQ